jgi:hypothetical protein
MTTHSLTLKSHANLHTMKEEAVQLGRSGLWLPAPLAIGTLQWGTTWVDGRILSGGRISDTTAAAIYAKLTRSGLVGLIDTAEGYGGGTSEQRIAYCERQLRTSDAETSQSDEHLPQPIIATKFLPTLWRWTASMYVCALACLIVASLYGPIGLFACNEQYQNI